jgi:hypothetical protein
MQVFELFFGRAIAQGGFVTDQAWDAFVDRVVAPNLPDGFTVLDASGAWLSPEGHRTMREPTRMLLVALPDSADALARIQRIREAYQRQFHQELVGMIVQPGCAAF